MPRAVTLVVVALFALKLNELLVEKVYVQGPVGTLALAGDQTVLDAIKLGLNESGRVYGDWKFVKGADEPAANAP